MFLSVAAMDEDACVPVQGFRGVVRVDAKYVLGIERRNRIGRLQSGACTPVGGDDNLVGACRRLKRQYQRQKIRRHTRTRRSGTNPANNHSAISPRNEKALPIGLDRSPLALVPVSP